MTLPTVVKPTYQVILPSDGKKVSLHPWTVGDEKVLALANESQDPKQIRDAFINVLTSCTDGKINVELLPIRDTELLFLHARARSVGEIVVLNVTPSPEDGCKCKKPAGVKVKINTLETKVEDDNEAPSEIKVGKNENGEDVFVKFREPYMGEINVDDVSNSDDLLVAKCIDSIYTEEEVMRLDDTTEDIATWIQSLDSRVKGGITAYFTGIPRVYIEAAWKCKCGQDCSRRIIGLANFFASV